jgi:short-subunit dehydrogenase
MNPTVLITGASSGIGAELARLYGRDQANLVLVARNRQRLDALAAELTAAFGCTAAVFPADLAQPGAAENLYAAVRQAGLTVDILINNAGAGSCGPVIASDPADSRQTIELNVTSLTILARLFAADMAARHQGKILNVASTGAYQPGPYIAVYYAAKAYVRSFSLALANELKEHGVHVATLCPGATATEFSRNAGKADLRQAMAASQVAEIAYRGLARNRRLIIPGPGNQAAIFLSKLLPGHLMAQIVRRIQEPLYNQFQAKRGGQ